MTRLRATKRRLEDWEAVFRALSHASRRQILLILRFRGGRMTARKIARRFSCSWPTTSRHLAVLVEAELIRVRKEGRERVYELDRERLLGVTGGWLEWFGDTQGGARVARTPPLP